MLILCILAFMQFAFLLVDSIERVFLSFFFFFPNDLMMSDKGDERIGFSQKNTRVSFPVYLDDLMNLLSCLFSGQNIQMILLLQL